MQVNTLKKRRKVFLRQFGVFNVQMEFVKPY